VLDIDDTYIFRFPRRAEVKAKVEKELCLLPELEKALPLAVPHFEYIRWGDSQPESCFVGYRKIPGTPLTNDLLKSKFVVHQLSEFLSRLHAFPALQAGCLKVPVFSLSEWRESYVDFYGWVKVNVYPLLDLESQVQGSCLWEGYLDKTANFRFAPVLIHGDLAEEHILCDPSRKVINGVIDWEDAAVGDPALDFTGLFWTGGQPAVESILASYRGQVDETFYQRILFYARLAPFYEIQFGLLTNNADHLQRGINTLCST
jgi:aminoglycoside 2''-phosphotransferase